MLLEPQEADRVAKSGVKIVFDFDTANSIFSDIQKELERLPDEAVESSCTVISQMLLLGKEALRAVNMHNTDEVLMSLYEMLKAYYKACEEREKKAAENPEKK